VRQGATAIIRRFAELRAAGCGFGVVDALCYEDIEAIGQACEGLPLLTAGSGVALGLPGNFRRAGELGDPGSADEFPDAWGLAAVVAGSCSVATNAQVATMRTRHPAFNVDALALARGHDAVDEALRWSASRVTKEPVLVYATATPDDVKAVQAELGVERAGALVEEALANIARGLVEQGVGRLIVAGGETSGAVVRALGVKGLRIGPEIDPGVPWTCTLGTDRPLMLALKSGNFGSPDFFLKAWRHLRGAGQPQLRAEAQR
jgi:uncharacterized protein YgbK (DUF1537 family)